MGDLDMGCKYVVKNEYTQPYFCCDSITYWTDQSQGFNEILDLGIIHNPDSMTIYWGVGHWI